MKRFKFSAFALLAISLISGVANASVTHADGDIYGDSKTVENSSGNWSLDGSLTVAGGIDGSGGTMKFKTPITVITATADTVGTVTAAKSGTLFVLGPTSVPVAGVGMTVTLPTAASGLTYTFTTATSSTLSVKTATSTDIIYFGGVNTLRLTSPASTGTTVTLVGNTNSWYIRSMTTGLSLGTGDFADSWTPAQS